MKTISIQELKDVVLQAFSKAVISSNFVTVKDDYEFELRFSYCFDDIGYEVDDDPEIREMDKEKIIEEFLDNNYEPIFRHFPDGSKSITIDFKLNQYGTDFEACFTLWVPDVKIEQPNPTQLLQEMIQVNNQGLKEMQRHLEAIRDIAKQAIKEFDAMKEQLGPFLPKEPTQ